MDNYKIVFKIFFVASILLFIIESCKKENPNSNINKQLILGKWYSDQKILDYKSFTYQSDSLLIADGTNISLGIIDFKWWWGTGDTIIINGASSVNIGYVTWEKVLNLTTDSLVLELNTGTPNLIYRYHK
jgi:hypothetical protein